MSLLEDYDAVEKSLPRTPRPIGANDVLWCTTANRYCLVARVGPNELQLVSIWSGDQHSMHRAYVQNVKSLTRYEATRLCCGMLRAYELVGHAGSTLKRR